MMYGPDLTYLPHAIIAAVAIAFISGAGIVGLIWWGLG